MLLMVRRAHPVVGTGALAAKGIELPGSDGIFVRCTLLQLHKFTQGHCVHIHRCLPPAASLMNMSRLPCGQLLALS